jgi:hypothetical protein
MKHASDARCCVRASSRARLKLIWLHRCEQTVGARTHFDAEIPPALPFLRRWDLGSKDINFRPVPADVHDAQEQIVHIDGHQARRLPVVGVHAELVSVHIDVVNEAVLLDQLQDGGLESVDAVGRIRVVEIADHINQDWGKVFCPLGVRRLLHKLVLFREHVGNDVERRAAGSAWFKVYTLSQNCYGQARAFARLRCVLLVGVARATCERVLVVSCMFVSCMLRFVVSLFRVLVVSCLYVAQGRPWAAWTFACLFGSS